MLRAALVLRDDRSADYLGTREFTRAHRGAAPTTRGERILRAVSIIIAGALVAQGMYLALFRGDGSGWLWATMWGLIGAYVATLSPRMRRHDHRVLARHVARVARRRRMLGPVEAAAFAIRARTRVAGGHEITVSRDYTRGGRRLRAHLTSELGNEARFTVLDLTNAPTDS